MKILGLGIYPIDMPRHGGQVRVANIKSQLELAGIAYGYISAYDSEVYQLSSVGPSINMAGYRHLKRYAAEGLCDDVEISHILAEHEPGFRNFVALIRDAAPSVIQLEQPWLWPPVKKALETGGIPKVPVIYSSQNIEYPLKREILEAYKHKSTNEVREFIEWIEKDICRSADLCFAVTKDDAEKLRSLGAKNVVVARNGTVRRNQGELWGVVPDERLVGIRYFLFVGSAHPPNAHGFLDLVGCKLGFLAPDERIVVVGSVSYLLDKMVANKKGAGVLRARSLFLGQIDDQPLHALLDNCMAVLLPISHGGGSNIKTAEAIHSGRPMIATSVAMRGFEDCIGIRNLYIADNVEQFTSRMRDLAGRRDFVATDNSPERDAVVWDRALAPMVDALKALHA